MKSAFTMIELIFVIVILGILASVAIPKLVATRDDAKIANLAQQIQIAISEIQASVVTKGKVDVPQNMSQVLKQMLMKNKAAVTSVDPINGSVGQLTLFTQNGGNTDDHAFVIDLNMTTFVIKHGTPCAGIICKRIQDRISEGNYDIAGERVVF